MYYIGLDVGGMSTKGALFNKKGEILERGTLKTIADQDYKVFVNRLKDLCLDMLQKQKLIEKDLLGIGMAIPGSIDTKKGIITYSNNIKFKNVPIVKEMQKYFNVPIKIGNDANLAVLGEMYFGSAKNYNDIVFITLGTGIGTGIISDKKLILGKAGAGAEGGHSVIRLNGEPCTCGRKGCWESYGSATALIKQTKVAVDKYPNSILADIAKKEGTINGKTAFDAERLGDAVGKKVVKKYLRYVGEGLVNLVNIFRPEIVLIGGGISNEGDALMKRIQRFVNRYSYGGENKTKVLVKKAELKNDAGIYGCLALFLED
ncbi:MAG TPA: ROK family protein [Clostridiales bacterium]|nr:ROK family protein [Clostridiales bacterium]